MTDVLSVAPPSRADLYIQIGQGHFVYYKNYAEKVHLMERRRHAEAHRTGISRLCTGETLDMFQGTEQCLN